MKRAGWEVVTILIVALAAVIAWKIVTGNHQAQLAGVESRLQDELASQAEEARKSREQLAADQASIVIQAFAAGVYPALISRRAEMIDQALVELLRLPKVIFVHLFESDGSVIASSDRKLTATGLSGAEWVLAVTELTARPSRGGGALELALPQSRPDETTVIIWIAYSLD